MKLIDFVVLKLILIELSMCYNVLNRSMFAYNFAAVSETLKKFLNLKKSYRDILIILNTYDVNEIDAVILSRLLSR